MLIKVLVISQMKKKVYILFPVNKVFWQMDSCESSQALAHDFISQLPLHDTSHNMSTFVLYYIIAVLALV